MFLSSNKKKHTTIESNERPCILYWGPCYHKANVKLCAIATHVSKCETVYAQKILSTFQCLSLFRSLTYINEPSEAHAAFLLIDYSFFRILISTFYAYITDVIPIKRKKVEEKNKSSMQRTRSAIAGNRATATIYSFLV